MTISTNLDDDGLVRAIRALGADSARLDSFKTEYQESLRRKAGRLFELDPEAVQRTEQHLADAGEAWSALVALELPLSKVHAALQAHAAALAPLAAGGAVETVWNIPDSLGGGTLSIDTALGEPTVVVESEWPNWKLRLVSYSSEGSEQRRRTRDGRFTLSLRALGYELFEGGWLELRHDH